MQILRRGSEGDEVRSWQHFLLGQSLMQDTVDGIFGPATEGGTRTFQAHKALEIDGAVGPLTYAAALQDGFDPGFADPQGGTAGADWPPRPVFGPLISNKDRQDVFGAFRYERITPGQDGIRILDDWEAQNIVPVDVPQLAHVEGAPKSGRIRVHRKVTEQVGALFAALEKEGLLALIRTWEGSFVPRYVRGSSTTLSNHAWGTAFDINAQWNQRGTLPALRGRVGSVRELVPIANHYGFFWGGHFSYRDGMHFEVALVLA